MNNMLGDRLAERKAMESAHAEALAKLQAALDTETAGHTEKAAALEAAQAEIESLRRELAASEERLAAASRGSEAASAPTPGSSSVRYLPSSASTSQVKRGGNGGP